MLVPLRFDLGGQGCAERRWLSEPISGFAVIPPKSQESPMRIKVDHSQFEIDGDRLTHIPTGAVFWMGETNIVNCEGGNTRPESGHDYDRNELMEVARELF